MIRKVVIFTNSHKTSQNVIVKERFMTFLYAHYENRYNIHEISQTITKRQSVSKLFMTFLYAND